MPRQPNVRAAGGPGFADLVLINGKILTMDDKSSVVEAVAILDGKLLATGSNARVKSMAGTRTRVLDLAGKTVVPGLIDTHAHFKAAGLSEYVVTMGRAKTVAEALDAIKTFTAKKKPGEWIVAAPGIRRPSSPRSAISPDRKSIASRRTIRSTCGPSVTFRWRTAWGCRRRE